MKNDLLAVRAAVRAEQRNSNRERMPNLAKVMDEIREKFPGAKLMWGVDLVTGNEVGRRDGEDPDKVFEIPEGYHPSRPVVLETKNAGRKDRGKTR